MKIPYFLIILTIYLAAEFSEGQKFNCEKPNLKNGRVRIRSKGRAVRFRCRKRFKLAGPKLALCINDEWNFPVPVCVAPGRKCPKQKLSKDLLVSESLNRGFLEISCKPGFTLEGKDKIYCDGSKWSDKAPTCVFVKPKTSCDFEANDLCGWTQDKQDTSFFDWTLATSLIKHSEGTGPSSDHTYLGKDTGHYLFMEASKPRKTGDFTRLLSPYYESLQTDLCFRFWYHMHGPDLNDEVGTLEIGIKNSEDDTSSYPPAVWSISGNQGDKWHQGTVEIRNTTSFFQIVITGTRGDGHRGDIALDDISLTNCTNDISTEETTVSIATTTKINDTSQPPTDNNSPTPGITTAISETPFHTTGQFADTTTFSEFTGLYSKTRNPTHLTSISTKGKSIVSTSQQAKIDSTTVLTTKMGMKDSTKKSLATTKLKMTTEQYINITTTGSKTDTHITESITHVSTELTRKTTEPPKQGTTTTEQITTEPPKQDTTTTEQITTEPPKQDTTTTERITTEPPKQETTTTEQITTEPQKQETTTTEQITTSVTFKPSTNAKTTERGMTSTTVKPRRRTKTSKQLTTLTTPKPRKEPKTTESHSTWTTIKPSEKTTVTRQPKTTTNKVSIIKTQSIITQTPEPRTMTTPASTSQKPTTTSQPTTIMMKTTTAVSINTTSTSKVHPTTATRSTDFTSIMKTNTTQSVSSKIPHFSTYKAKTSPSNPTASSTPLSKTTLSVNTTMVSTTAALEFNNTINEDVVPVTKMPLNETDIPNIIVNSRLSAPDETPIKPLVIGLGVGVAIGLVIVVVGSYLWIKRRRRKEEECDEMRPITGTGSQEW